MHCSPLTAGVGLRNGKCEDTDIGAICTLEFIMQAGLSGRECKEEEYDFNPKKWRRFVMWQSVTCGICGATFCILLKRIQPNTVSLQRKTANFHR